jgi:anaphase-promoting complex subunit 2
VEDPNATLEHILKTLTAAQAIYLYQFKTYLLPTTAAAEASPRKTPRRSTRKPAPEEPVKDNDPRVRAFLRSLNSLISYSLPDPAWSELVYTVLLDLCGVAVGIRGKEPEHQEEDEVMTESDSIYDRISQSFVTETDLDGDSILVADDDGDIIVPEQLDGFADFEAYKAMPKGAKAEARRKVLKLWAAMEKLGVGGGGRRGERVFAEIINTLITGYIEQTFARKWESPSLAGHELTEWVENTLGKLIVDILFPSTGGGGDKLSPRESLRVSRESLNKRRRGGMEVDAGGAAEDAKRRIEDLESWKKIALGRLGRLRVKELFDIIVDWPNSLGGIEDLKAYISTPQTRQHLTTMFSAALNQRILHPAAATADIVAAYIRLIRAFAVLDPRGVLLDRVNRNIRKYLRDRDDTVRIIIRGIMSASLPAPSPSELRSTEEIELSELHKELSKGIPSAASTGLEELDFDDMLWVPDPVDAGPEFRRSKGLDVVGSLITLYDSREVWIKEVQKVLADKLLTSLDYSFATEIRTIELLKLRFGDAPTQAFDVMLKDIADSKRQNAVIRESQQLHLYRPDFHAKILSRLYWPRVSAPEPTFLLPRPMTAAMQRYEKGFEALKKKRKISWRLSAGTIAVELELADRVVRVDTATPAQAAVIYAFGTEDDSDDHMNRDSDDPATLTMSQLVHMLKMEEDLVGSCIGFWMSQEVIHEVEPGTYAVVENRSSLPAAALPGTPGGVHHQRMMMDGPSHGQSEVEKLRERMVVEQFVMGMLTNGGPMETYRIMTMLSMLVPGGFTWTAEDLGEFLAEMKVHGKVTWGNGCWRVVGGV